MEVLHQGGRHMESLLLLLVLLVVVGALEEVRGQLHVGAAHSP